MRRDRRGRSGPADENRTGGETVPLTNVWCRDGQGEWTRITAEKAEKDYRYTVSVHSRLFRCYHCFQYVTFVKGDGKTSHFRHSSGEMDKSCADRCKLDEAQMDNAVNAPRDQMRLRLEDGTVELEIGFAPVGKAALGKAITAHALVMVEGRENAPHHYWVDRSRFGTGRTTWLPLPLEWAVDFAVTGTPPGQVPRAWTEQRTGIDPAGTVFDVRTGKRIPERSDAEVGRPYYLLCDRWKYISVTNPAVQIRPVLIKNDAWKLYRISAPAYSPEAADYFFDYLHLRLTRVPAELHLLWPPVLEKDEMVETGSDSFEFLVTGEADFEAFPGNEQRTIHVRQIDEQQQLIRVEHAGALQMVCAAREHQRLSCLYIRPPDTQWRTAPALESRNTKGQVLDEPDLPKDGVIVLCSEVDASVTVEENGVFRYRKAVPAGKETQIPDCTKHTRIIIRQGLDIVQDIQFGKAKKKEQVPLVPWQGRMVPFPGRYAGVLDLVPKKSCLYRKVLQALRTGTIPEEAWKSLRKAMGERNG